MPFIIMFPNKYFLFWTDLKVYKLKSKNAKMEGNPSVNLKSKMTQFCIKKTIQIDLKQRIWKWEKGLAMVE